MSPSSNSVTTTGERGHLRNGDQGMLKSLHVVLALALLLAMTGDSAAKSQRPSPSNRESIEPPQTQSTQSKEAAPQYPRGTEDSPAFVKIIPTLDEQQRAAAETKREDDKAANDRSIALFTGRLFWATVALSVIAVGQLFAFLWQGIQLKRAVDLANREFIATHRPRLKIRRTFVVGFHERFPNAGITPGQELNASIEIVNIGDTKGTIVWSRYRIYFGKQDYSLITHYVPPHTLAPGPVTLDGGQRLGFELVDRVPNDAAQEGALIRPRWGQDDWHMVVIGEVRYADGNGCIRYLGFCREMRSYGRFRAVADPDYEYED
jgi:hypothetical protein